MNFEVRVTIAAVGIALFSCAGAFASTNQPVTVAGSVTANCTTLTPSPSSTLAFNSYDPFSLNDTSAGPVTFSTNCTRGDTNLNVAVSGGLNFSNATTTGYRAMKDATNKYLTYQLFQAANGVSPWTFNTSSGNGTQFAQTAGGISSANTFSLYGIIPHGQVSGANAPDVGTYSDQVTVTVNY